MKTTNKLVVATFTLLTVLALSGCGNQNSKQSQAGQQPTQSIKHDKSKEKAPKEKEIIKHKDINVTSDDTESTAPSNSSVSTTPAASNSTNYQTNKAQNGTSQNNAVNNTAPQTTPNASIQSGQTQGASAGYSNIESAADALSLFEFDLGFSGGYTVTTVPEGYYIKPIEPAFGHQSFLMKSNGNLYQTDGTTLIKTFGEMAKAKDPDRPEYGWHGY